MSSMRLGIGAAVLAADALLLLVIGYAMWSDPPAAADAAVGKGLMALGTALAVPAFVLVLALLDGLDDQRARSAPERS